MAEPEPAAVAAAFELSAVPIGRAILHLKSWAREPPSLDGLPSALASNARLLALGPVEWLLVSDGIEGPGLHASMASLARSRGMAAVDLSDGMAGVELGGSAVRDILSAACGLDLHPAAFPVGSCTRTRLAQLPVVIVCIGKTRYEVYVGASYAPYLEGWLRDAAAGLPA